MSTWPPMDLETRERFAKLQQLRQDAGLDAILIAIGPDAAFSRANEAVFNWLLLGLSGREALNSVSGRYEESLVCLGPRSLIFCKKADFEDLTLRTATWDQTFLVSPSETDVDAYEDKKIGTFIEMVKDCRRLGVFLGESEVGQDLKMAVEKWPVVQAFGYDEFGLGFLTLNREVVNLEPKINELFAAWDETAQRWAKGVMPQLHKAWSDALTFHDQHSREEALAAAPIVDYFVYGRLDDEVQTAINPSPRLLVGKHTSEILSPAVPGAVPLDEPDARHMIWEAVDPMTGVALTRTYGLTTPFEPRAKEVLLAYAACCCSCRELLRDPKNPRRASEIFQEHGLSQAPEVFTCHIDAFGLSRETSGLRFVRVSCLVSGGVVAYGDSSFGDEELNSSVASWAYWPHSSEEARSMDVKNGLETAMGLKVEWGRSVALGRGKDVWVYLDPPEQPPDPLNLGEEPIDVETPCELAVSTGEVLSIAPAVVWTYNSGKVVVSSGRSGYIVLTASDASATVPAAKGQVWAAMQSEPWLHVAVSVSPETWSSWPHRGPGEGELSWLKQEVHVRPGKAPAAPAPPLSQKQLLVTGLPGCGVIEVARALARLLQGACWDLQGKDLAEVSGDEEWLVLCDVERDPAEIQAQFPELLVLSVLEPGFAYPWQSARHPRLHEHCGLVALRPAKETQEHRALSSLLAKEMQLISHQVLLRPLTSHLLEAVRSLVPRPRGARPARPSMSRCFVASGVLDLQLVRSHFMSSLEEAADAFCKPATAKVSAWQGLVCIEVKALMVESSKAFWEDAQPVERSLAFGSRGEVVRQQWQEPLSSKRGAVFWFCGEAAAAEATALLKRCAVQEPPEEPLWEPATLPEDLRDQVRLELQAHVPEGYSFDGNRYINQETYISSKDHPLLVRRLEEIAQQRNVESSARRQRTREIMASPPFARPLSPSKPPTGRPRPRGYA